MNNREAAFCMKSRFLFTGSFRDKQTKNRREDTPLTNKVKTCRRFTCESELTSSSPGGSK